jgi:hypothetical protein
MISDTSPAESTRPSAGSGPGGANRWIALVVLSLAQLMVILDSTIVNIALPTAQRDLGFSTDDRQWVVTGYALAFGSLLLLGGRLSDLFGRKRVFIISLVRVGPHAAHRPAAARADWLCAGRSRHGEAHRYCRELQLCGEHPACPARHGPRIRDDLRPGAERGDERGPGP